MKKTNKVRCSTLILVILLIFSSVVYSQGIPGGGHDSLLFDGANDNPAVLKNAGICKIKVMRINGVGTGTICRKKIYSVCGQKDTSDECEVGQIFPDDMLKAGDKISTGFNGHMTVMLTDGKTIRFAPNTSIVINSNYCDNDFRTEVDLEEGILFINAKPNGKTKGINVITENGSAIIEGTEFTYSRTKEGGVNTDILRVYEGVVKFKKDLQSEMSKKKDDEKDNAAEKLNEDYQSGKITIEELLKRIQEMQAGAGEYLKFEVTVNAGYQSSITGGDNPTEPEAFDAGAYPWGED